MEMKQRTFKEVTSLATTCLKTKLSRANGTLRYYNGHWRKLERFMETKGIQFIDPDISSVYFGKSEPPLRQSEPPAKVGWICM